MSTVKVPAVHVDITDDGTHYTVTATPWPTIDAEPYPYRARLPKVRVIPMTHGYREIPLDLAAFVKKLMNTYPKASV